MHRKVDGFSTIHILNSHETVLTYYVATYRSIQQGQLVDSGIQLGPVEVKYENGYTKAEVMATVVAGRYQLLDPIYVSSFTAFANPELSAAKMAGSYQKGVT